MSELWFRHDVEALARRQGMIDPGGLVLKVGCHPEAGVRGDVQKERQGRPCETVLHVFCYACDAAVVDIAVREPIPRLNHCGHRLVGPLLAYHRGEIILLCPVCDQAYFLAPVARRQDFWRKRDGTTQAGNGADDHA